jgi:hypothetical protein
MRYVQSTRHFSSFRCLISLRLTCGMCDARAESGGDPKQEGARRRFDSRSRRFVCLFVFFQKYRLLIIGLVVFLYDYLFLRFVCV